MTRAKPRQNKRDYQRDPLRPGETIRPQRRPRRLRETTEDQQRPWRPGRNNGDQAETMETKEDQQTPLETKRDHQRDPLETWRDHQRDPWRPGETTGPQQRPRRLREISGDQTGMETKQRPMETKEDQQTPMKNKRDYQRDPLRPGQTIRPQRRALETKGNH